MGNSPRYSPNRSGVLWATAALSLTSASLPSGRTFAPEGAPESASAPHLTIDADCEFFASTTINTWSPRGPARKLKLRELLEAHEGVLLDFWGTFCAPCVQKIPELADLQRDFPEVRVVMLTGEDAQTVGNFFTAHPTRYRDLLIWGTDAAAVFVQFGINETPTALFCSKKDPEHLFILDRNLPLADQVRRLIPGRESTRLNRSTIPETSSGAEATQLPVRPPDAVEFDSDAFENLRGRISKHFKPPGLVQKIFGRGGSTDLGSDIDTLIRFFDNNRPHNGWRGDLDTRADVLGFMGYLLRKKPLLEQERTQLVHFLINRLETLEPDSDDGDILADAALGTFYNDPERRTEVTSLCKRLLSNKRFPPVTRVALIRTLEGMEYGRQYGELWGGPPSKMVEMIDAHSKFDADPNHPSKYRFNLESLRGYQKNIERDLTTDVSPTNLQALFDSAFCSCSDSDDDLVIRKAIFLGRFHVVSKNLTPQSRQVAASAFAQAYINESEAECDARDVLFESELLRKLLALIEDLPNAPSLHEALLHALGEENWWSLEEGGDVRYGQMRLALEISASIPLSELTKLRFEAAQDQVRNRVQSH